MATSMAKAEPQSATEPVVAMAAMRRGTAPVDLIHLARQTFGSIDLEREVLRLFVQQGGGLAQCIAEAASGVERAEAAHRLKGSARAIGAMRVGRIAEALEEATSLAEIATLTGELNDAVGEVERFVADLLRPSA